jgi:hypothetical protein
VNSNYFATGSDFGRVEQDTEWQEQTPSTYDGTMAIVVRQKYRKVIYGKKKQWT